MLVGTPLVKAEQHSSIRVEELTKVGMRWSRRPLAEQWLIPLEAARHITHPDDRPRTLHDCPPDGPTLWCAAGRCWHRTRCPRRAVRTTVLMGGPRHSLHAPNGVQSVSARPGSLLPWTRLGRLKELHDVAAWVLDQDLLPAGARYDLVRSEERRVGKEARYWGARCLCRGKAGWRVVAR